MTILINSNMHRFLIADDHAIVRVGFKARFTILQAFPSAIIEEVANGDDLYRKVTLEEWDVVISDISMPGRSALEILQHVRLDRPRLPVLFLSAYSEDQYAIRVLKAGASGYMHKEAAGPELIRAVNQLLLGRKYITHSTAEKMATNLNGRRLQKCRMNIFLTGNSKFLNYWLKAKRCRKSRKKSF